jgi:beta-N-acetylhexosaminidase
VHRRKEVTQVIRGRFRNCVLATAVLAAAGIVSAGAPASAATIGVGTDPAAAFTSLSEAQRVGQLFMVGGAATGVSAATVAAVRDYHVGSVILTGRSSAGVQATRQVTDGVRALATVAATGGVPMLVATDQEGGQVQVLSGAGFSAMPTALAQGQESVATLQQQADQWGAQLRAAGVDLNLAPVLGTVPAGASNAPLGRYDREYGHTPDVVTSHGVAFLQGMLSSGIGTAAKHFPGLGRVDGNTDTSAGVVDTVTTRNDPYLQPFRAAVAAGTPVLMVSTATYTKIDPAHRAVFSPTVLGGMLRGDLGFRGAVVSDDLGSAVGVADLSPAERAIRFIDAGGDLVLTVDPSVIPAMVSAVVSRAQSDAAFRAKVDAAAHRVLEAKRAVGLIGFRDVSDAMPFAPQIYRLAAQGVIHGYMDGTFRPTGQVSREAFAAFLARSLGLPQGPCQTAGHPDGTRFSDVPDSSPFCSEINGLAAVGVLGGFPDGTFGPFASTSRQAAAAFLYRAYRYRTSAAAGDAAVTDTRFSDVDQRNPFSGDIAFLTDQGVIAGYADGTFLPGAYTSRQAAAAFIDRLASL